MSNKEEVFIHEGSLNEVMETLKNLVFKARAEALYSMIGAGSLEILRPENLTDVEALQYAESKLNKLRYHLKHYGSSSLISQTELLLIFDENDEFYAGKAIDISVPSPEVVAKTHIIDAKMEIYTVSKLLYEKLNLDERGN